MLALASLLLSGCAILRELGPAVEIEPMTPGEYIALKRGDILTSGKFSAATLETIRVAGLDGDGEACTRPEAVACIQTLADAAGLSDERRHSALSELWLRHAQSLPAATKGVVPDAGDARIGAWLEVARHAYAYLFFSERTPGSRAFEDRQTQVRDYYNLAVQEASSLLFARLERGDRTPVDGVLRLGGWNFRADLSGLRLPGQGAQLQDLLPASSLGFAGLRSTYRRDGFGAELVAVMADDPVASVSGADAAGAGRPARPPVPLWSEIPETAVTALLRFPGENLAQVLSTHDAQLSAHDPYREEKIELHGQDVPLAANFTAGYGLWLARSGFARQSLRSLLGKDQGIDRPRLFLMQPYDPQRRVILMVHGLASSPEAWVNLANELMGDKQIRQHFQIWQFYYPTNMPIPVSHHAIRQTLADVLKYFDPQGTAPASRDMVLVGHSMGGVIARLMVSSTVGDGLWNRLFDGRALDDGRMQRLRERIGPMLHFEPEPEVDRAIFIASPHRGTDVAGSRLGRWIGGFVRLPLTLLEGFGDVIQDLAHAGQAQAAQPQPKIPNSIDNLDKSDPFVQAAADLPISPCVHYHSIIGHYDPEKPLAESDDGVVPYWSSHLDGAESEKVIRSFHSVQETAAAIIEIRRILHEDVLEHGSAPAAAEAGVGCR